MIITRFRQRCARMHFAFTFCHLLLIIINFAQIFVVTSNGNTNSSGDPVSSEVLHDMFTSDSTAIKNVSTSLENSKDENNISTTAFTIVTDRKTPKPTSKPSTVATTPISKPHKTKLTTVTPAVSPTTSTLDGILAEKPPLDDVNKELSPNGSTANEKPTDDDYDPGEDDDKTAVNDKSDEDEKESKIANDNKKNVAVKSDPIPDDQSEDSHFFTFLIIAVIIVAIIYVFIHNKKKILALILEGRANGGAKNRRSNIKYKKLGSKLTAEDDDVELLKSGNVIY